MPIKHSALKQVKKDRKRTQRNQAVRSQLKTVSRRLLGLLQARQLDQAQALLRELASQCDRAVSKGIVHRNAADRLKSRLARRVNHAAAGA
jgi:small subunit ribosomal protein S20